MIHENDNETSDTLRGARLVRRVPILAHVVKQRLCTERQLLRAFKSVAFNDGEYIYYQGQPGRDVLFIDEGKVLMTQRRRSRVTSTVGSVHLMSPDNLSNVVIPRQLIRKRSQMEAEMENQLYQHGECEYFGEESFLQGFETRMLNAVAHGAVTCFILPEAAFSKLLTSVHELMLYRHLVRKHGVLPKQQIFQHLSPIQIQYLVDHCTLKHYDDGVRIVEKGDKEDDQYFLLVKGEADIVLDEYSRPKSAVHSGEKLYDEKLGMDVPALVVCRKTLYQGFGEMGILCRPRTAHVVAVGNVICVAISRKIYVGASQLLGASGIDINAESRFAMSLIEEWLLGARIRDLYITNPSISHLLKTFVKRFKAAYMQKVEGKTLYLKFLQRLHADPVQADEFPFLADRVAYDQPFSSLSIIRSETRRILSLRPADRSPFEINAMARLLEQTTLIDKFDRPNYVDKLALARGIGQYATFLTIPKDKILCRQGKVESRAFLILRGNINIVNEDVKTFQPDPAKAVYDVLATLSAGDSFGELSLVTRLQRSASALAACESDLLVLERAHLHALKTLLPGVSIQGAIIQRADFLAALDFLRDSDFSQCIRVAHDLQEKKYEPRHIFLHEPIRPRTLYIVKSGEVAVYLRQQVPIVSTIGPDVTQSQCVKRKQVLVRVATIGPHEFFGYDAMLSSSAPETIPPLMSSTNVVPSSVSATDAQEYVAATLASITPTIAAPTHTTQDDLAITVFMCTTPVQMLELTESGWKRLSLSSLHSIHTILLERHRWNCKTVQEQTNQGNCAYFVADKPWQLISTTAVANGNMNKVERVICASQLVRRIKDKKQQRQHSLPILCEPSQRDRLVPSQRRTKSSRKSPDFTENLSFAPSTVRSPLLMSLGGSFRPVVAVVSPNSASFAYVAQSRRNIGPVASYPRPPETVLDLTKNLSPRRSTTFLKRDTTRNAQSLSEDDYKDMWKLQRSPFATI